MSKASLGTYFFALPLPVKSNENGSRQTPQYADSHEHYLLFKKFTIMSETIFRTKAKERYDYLLKDLEQGNFDGCHSDHLEGRVHRVHQEGV